MFVGIGDAAHDTSICIYHEGTFKYRKSERHLNIKHHEANLDWYTDTLNSWGVKKIKRLVFTHKGTSIFGRKPYNGEDYLHTSNFLSIPCEEVICLDHHLAHLYSGNFNLQQHAIFDGRGSGLKKTGRYTGLIKTPNKTIRYKNMSIGEMLKYVGRYLCFTGLDIDFPGKIMGLHAYGTPNLKIIDQINQDNFVELLSEWSFDINNANNKKFQDVVATIHKACELIQLNYFNNFDQSFPISCSGGVMLNTVINRELLKKYELLICPHVYDGGLSIGCLKYAVGENFNIPGFPYVQDDIAPDDPTDETINLAAEYLAQGKIIGWYQGHGELGPRALGNRSILMNPTIKYGKDILNQRVKKREWWRPFGASVTKEDAYKYFDIDDSPYMLYNAKVLVDGLDPITHVDGTCRHQTVENGHFYRLLKRFEEKTGLPVLLNTSLNVGGKPIASNKQSAMVSGLDHLFFGNEVCDL